MTLTLMLQSLQAPYPDLEAVRAARRRGDSAAAELLSRGLL